MNGDISEEELDTFTLNERVAEYINKYKTHLEENAVEQN